MTGNLSLRSRVLAALGLVAVALITVATIVTVTIRAELISRVDDQLIATRDPGRAGLFPVPGERGTGPIPPTDAAPDLPERISAVYEGVLRSDGTLVTFFAPNIPGQTYSPPELTTSIAAANAGDPFTVSSEDGATEYRVLTTIAGTDIFVRALPLTDANSTTQRLILVQAVGLGITLLVLSAVGFWVIRLGIRPINAMTATAGGMTDADLSVRLPEPPSEGTEAGRLARTLNRLLDRIETAVSDQRASDERLRQFVADASHELRTPLTTVAGYASLYNKGGLRNQDALDDAMRRTEMEADRMNRLVEDMLVLAHHDQQRPLDYTTVDLETLLADVAADARTRSAGHHIEERLGANLQLSGDDDRLRQAMSNIVGNALTHTPDGTTITITADGDDSSVTIEIGDDGPGIAAEHLDHLTERFYRAERSRSRARGGSGLGLAIAEAAVEAHGGTLTLHSEPDMGTTAQIILPR